MSSKSFPSEYENICATCNGWISPGDMIAYDENDLACQEECCR